MSNRATNMSRTINFITSLKLRVLKCTRPEMADGLLRTQGIIWNRSEESWHEGHGPEDDVWIL